MSYVPRPTDGRRYDSTGEPVAQHAAWRTSLAIMVNALRAANKLKECAALSHGAEAIGRQRDELRAAIAGGDSFEACNEQNYALQLVDQVSQLRDGQAVAQLRLIELLKPALVSLPGMLMQSPEELQRYMPPKSRSERVLAGLLPSGAPLPAYVTSHAALQDVMAAVQAPACGSAYWTRLSASLQGSLCAVLSACSRPEALSSITLTDLGGEATLAAALCAALRCLGSLHSNTLSAGAVSPGLAAPEHCALLRAAQMCIGVYSGIALQGAATQLSELERAMALAVATDLENVSQARTHRIANVSKELNTYVHELERLPDALCSWAEAAMDEQCIDDASFRQAIVTPLADVREAVVRGVSRAKLIAAAL